MTWEFGTSFIYRYSWTITDGNVGGDMNNVRFDPRMEISDTLLNILS